MAMNGHDPSSKTSPTDANGLVSHDDFYNYAFKVMLVGDSCVGKTCLMIRFKDNTFLHNNFIATVGMDYRNKTFDVNGIKIKLQLWDTAGQERFRSLTHAYYRDADAVILLFDLAARATFDHCRTWLDDIKKHSKYDVVVFLVGNKCDLTSMRQVQMHEALKLAEDHQITYAETSGKTGLNVDVLFKSVAEDLIKRRSGTLTTQRTSIDLNAPSLPVKRACCL